ncbi:efflux RND transporter permease subunit [Actimicrobium sp. CCC2.4]|uniref:efflux RND transporter permease subunit n=2 Tax=Actimicrobium sp. CCC2.4 TaxID=3048606 RepID=UPI002AC93982|nr:efflux RND transporter permease subunit [Actimicrobium sp. CCC2.4]WPX32259.1 efflux RND transporter permease subunit [Actimicrobium sp. CCC2.4]
MWITKVSIRNPVFATMVMVALMVLGLASYRSLGVEKMPDVQFPFVFIQVLYPGASPEAVENDITKPIENVVNTVRGVKKIVSSSFEGRSLTFIEFDLSANMDHGIQEVRDKIATVRAAFPKDAKEPFVARQEENAQPVATLTLTSASGDMRALSTLSEQVVVKRLQNVAGVGQVTTGGNTSRQILINVDPSRMTAQNIGIDEVLRAIQITNQDMPAGVISRGPSEQLVRVEGKIKDPRAFGKIVVARRASGPVFLDQVADIVDGEREETSISRVNGQRAININITKVQDANIIEVGTGLKKAVADMAKTLPAGSTLTIVNSNSDSVERQLDGVKATILEGAVLTMLIVFLFLHSWRSTIITGLTLPISVMATFIAMKAFGFTINALTLMALSLCIGLLIDDAIVVRENIVRHLGMGKSHKDAANDGTSEIGLAVMATTFAIVAVFVPVAFMDGIIGRFFLQFGITVTVAVLVSLFVSFTLDPMLSSVWRDPVENRFRYLPWLGRLMERIEHGIDRLHVRYGRALEWALRWRKVTLLSALLLFVGSLALVPLIGAEMFPETDEGFVTLKFKTAVGSSLAYTDEKIRQVETALKDFPEIASVITTVGGQDGANTAEVSLKLTDRKSTGRRRQKDLEALIRQRLKPIAGLELSVGFQKAIYIAILGQDIAKLDAVAKQVMLKLATIKGVTDLENSLAASTPSVVVKIDNERASDLGLTQQQIGAALRPFVAGDTTSYWLAQDGQNYEVNVQLPKAGRERITDLGNLSVASKNLTPDGRVIMVPLRQVVEFIPATSPQVIKRQALQRRVGIYGNVEGRPAGDVNKEVQAIIKTIDLPDGVRFDVGGQAEQMKDMLGAAVAALGIAVIFIYLVLASQFGSFLQPVAIMVSLPLSLIGVLLALLITGSTLNMFSIIGFIMLMGLVTKNAILLVDFTNHSQLAGQSQHDAILTAGQVRLRPILMTTMAMIFGMLPMALGIGDGGESQAPMGRAVIGGVITSTLLTLLVVPVAYTYLDAWGRRAKGFFRGAEAPSICGE